MKHSELGNAFWGLFFVKLVRGIIVLWGLNSANLALEMMLPRR